MNIYVYIAFLIAKDYILMHRILVHSQAASKVV